MHYLYRITNIKNNKIYIGQAINLSARWSVHKNNALNPERSTQYIHYAMAKHKIHNFIFEHIATCKSQDDADELEMLLIQQYKSLSSQHGYNIKNGGKAGSHSESTKEKLRKAMFKQIAEKGHPAQGKKWTDEQKANLSATLKALDKDKIYTPEVRKRMSDAHLGQKPSAETLALRVESLKKSWASRIDYSRKCAAPGCEVSGRAKYRIINNIRYCANHGDRMRRNGDLEPRSLGAHNIGREPPNKHKFSKDEIDYILISKSSTCALAREFGVTEKVIKRVRDGNF